MRAIGVFALSTTLCFAFAGSPRAGDFGAPMHQNVCGNFDVAFMGLAFPDQVYVGAATPELCENLCNRARKVCRLFVNDVFSCQMRRHAIFRTFNKLNCESISEVPANRKACKTAVTESIAEDMQETRVARVGHLDDCETWGTTCRASCQ